MQALRKTLDQLQKKHQRHIESDPIYFAHQHTNPQDQEIVAFISAMLAFGNVKAIFRTLGNIVSFLDPNPYEKILRMADAELKSHRFFKHRWITTQDMKNFLKLLQKILHDHKSLEKSFLQFKTNQLDQSLMDWFDFLKEEQVRIQNKNLTRGQKFLFSSPKGKSAAKRLMMFMRWMVRKDYPDLGLWRSVSTCELLIPLDIHLFQFSHHLGFTNRKQANWPTVLEITDRFKKLNPDDPTCYDFALARLGIMNLCIHKVDSKYCDPCLIKKHCTLHR